MKKAIGGLLVVSMLTVPQAIDLNYMAYLALKNHNILYASFIKDEGGSEDIDRAMDGMDENSRTITELLKARSATLARLEARMDLLRQAGTALNDGQIANYADFMKNYRKGSRELTNILKATGGEKNLKTVQKEILSENTDYELVMNSLVGIIGAQNAAIDNLTLTIYEGERVLAAL